MVICKGYGPVKRCPSLIHSDCTRMFNTKVFCVRLLRKSTDVAKFFVNKETVANRILSSFLSFVLSIVKEANPSWTGKFGPKSILCSRNFRSATIAFPEMHGSSKDWKLFNQKFVHQRIYILYMNYYDSTSISMVAMCALFIQLIKIGSITNKSIKNYGRIWFDIVYQRKGIQNSAISL